MAPKGLRDRWRGLADRLDALSLRERGMAFVAILVVLYFAAVHLVFAPLQAHKTQLQREIASRQEGLRTLTRQIEALAVRRPQDRVSRARARVAALRAQLRSLDASLGAVTAGLVPPRKMVGLVREVLARNPGLRLIRIESLPAEPLYGARAGRPGARVARAATNGSAPMLYRHGMRLVLEGRYLDILKYLRALEALPWKVFWGEVSLQTQHYPVSRVTLVLYTLSTHQGWIAL